MKAHVASCKESGGVLVSVTDDIAYIAGDIAGDIAGIARYIAGGIPSFFLPTLTFFFFPEHCLLYTMCLNGYCKAATYFSCSSENGLFYITPSM
jgi:hypothetical protein